MPSETLPTYIVPSSPYQPDTAVIKPQIMAKRTLHFQSSWFTKFPWLHYVPSLEGVLCHICSQAHTDNQLNLAKCSEPVFTTEGFNNWKKALQRFAVHENSHTHRVSANAQAHKRCSQPVAAQLSSQKAAEQATSRECLLRILTSVRFLARQDLALRGGDADDGNFQQLLRLRCDNAPALKAWLNKKTTMTSWLIQNEIMEMLSHAILRKIMSDIHDAKQFALIIDGTQDLGGIEQEAVCIRYVDRKTLKPCETFVGLHELVSTTGQSLVAMAQDVLIRLDLPIAFLRGQTYDGAANMSGIHNGCQAIITDKQPLALFVHCGAHCTNLVAQSAACAAPCVQDAMQWLQELGNFYGASIKYRQSFADVAISQCLPVNAIKPLCPTRWLTRTPAIQSVLDRYSVVLESLQEAKSTDPQSRAAGLLDRFEKGATVLGLMMALRVFSPLEQLNKSLQSSTATIGGMIAAVHVIKRELAAMRTPDTFNELFEEANRNTAKLDLDPITLPRRRQPPRRLTGSAPAYHAQTASEHYRLEFFRLLDSAITQLSERFSENAVGLQKYRKLEEILLTGVVDGETISAYPELDAKGLAVELGMFRHNHTYTCVSVELCNISRTCRQRCSFYFHK